MICPKCGALMSPKVENGKVVFKCPRCGYEGTEGRALNITRRVAASPENKVVVIENPEELISLPKVKAVCPKCGHTEAYLRIEQTRSADEPPTRIYTCVKCKYTWREYS